MTSLNPQKWGKKEKNPPTLQEELKDLGVHFHTDNFFEKRLQNIETELTEFIPEDEIDQMEIPEARKILLKMCMRRLRYAWGHIPFGKSKDDYNYAKGMSAARKLLLRAERAIMSDADDRQVANYCRSIFARIDILVGVTFDAQNVSITKSVAIQQAMPQQGGNVEVRTHNSADPTNQS